MRWRKAVVYDDVPSYARELKEMLQDALPETEVVAATTAKVALEALEQCDLLVLDIELEDHHNGIAFFQQLQQETERRPAVIFTSSYLHNVERVFEVEADGYLMKPVTPDRLKLCLQRVARKTQRSTMMIPVKNGVVSLAADAVLYVENDTRHARYYCADQKQVLSTAKFSELDEMLPACFCRSHKSFYVNLSHVSSLRRYAFTLHTGEEVPVSQSRYTAAKEAYTAFMGKML